ncbi:glycoside hydrolase family 76 protein [Melanomma pulvis-pyrius CBS 109.77]|uniref:Mannan endo-1,6-alpha-mannosidase n=1 Tax=Melanomma pulvis-pyrius CBS 109.77 TaxID=1314802 RepID=A0A6A6XNK3_9PLEO|nr:glycoside hydrolase family 76 protein [Melanomma pulvis-pyrius CBS 109.77]
MRWFSPARALLALSCMLDCNVFTATAIDLDPTQPDQVRAAAKLVAAQLVSLYAKDVSKGSEPSNLNSGEVGMLPFPPYFWWEAGAMFGQLIDYWYYTNDSTYNQLVVDGIQAQIGVDKNFLPVNHAKDIGNDDQLFWAFTAMSAAELGFPDPKPDQPGWLELAQSVMNQLIHHYDTDPPACNGGLRWQNQPFKTGYNYKNTAANGGMFQLGARLAKYTGNKTYEVYANKAFDWMLQSPLIEDNFRVNDGTDVNKLCVAADRTQWTYNYGIMIGGAAYMYNYTNGHSTWRERLQGFLNQTANFFPEATGSVMIEVCEKLEVCNPDQLSFKAYLARWLALSAQIAPFTAAQIAPILQHSAKAAARTCNAANECGSRWNFDAFDGLAGAGQQMSALGIITANLFVHAKPQVTADTGGHSKGNPAAGTGNPPPIVDYNSITTADRAGAWIITVMVAGLLFGGAWWLVVGEGV